MRKIIILFLPIFIFFSCKDPSATREISEENKQELQITKIGYAKGFDIEYFDGYEVITLKNPWPGTDKIFRYALIEENASRPTNQDFDAVVQLPIKKIVVTSTTHIPSLEMLGVTKTLKGFPNLDYISSEQTRKRISEGKIRELGKNEALNTEILIDLEPDAVIGFAVDGNNSTFNTIQKMGIPVIYNSDWTETSPLGKAEWIKFFGILFNKEREADSIFSEIESEYLSAKKIAANSTETPTVISGALYKDIWYMPQGESWGAQFIADANGNYLWKNSKGTGSISLNLEAVLEKGSTADYWIGPGQFTSLDKMKNSNSVYPQFLAFQKGNVYTYSLKKGETGGLLYYELAPNRPDLVLKDIIKILHPTLLENHQFYFFDKLN
ncbi:ABC transporter substrate-binding protein [Aequorivita echinoideorum]|uniref:ABC transporter substrate-binding protein n=1 Tax=Aequorivita echinoideorum TaxID=1549647 RepID=A0ABS5S581_9FLAO|nr:ABC transporter substrate-binding protein [Aequorivita echinoideorum]MBT0608133.1 ABC transporter substrate-binding protein [Aequorivita echinoideorum]